MSEGVNVPEIDINLEDESVRAWGGQSGPVLPVGTYTMDITEAEQTTSKTNNPAVKVKFKVADEGEHLGVEMSKTYSLQAKALGRIKQLMIAANARLDKIRPSELIGARILVDITHVQGQAVVQADGSLKEGGTFCDITNETALAAPEPPPPPPPAAKAKPTQPAATAKPANGSAPAGARRG